MHFANCCTRILNAHCPIFVCNLISQIVHDTWGQIGADRKRVGDGRGGAAGSQRGKGQGLRSPGRCLGGGSLVGAVSAAYLEQKRHASHTTASTRRSPSPTHPSGC